MACEGTEMKCLYCIRDYSKGLQFPSHITHFVTIFLPTLNAIKKYAKMLKRLKFVVMVEKDFVTMFTGFRIAVNVDCKHHPSSKR